MKSTKNKLLSSIATLCVCFAMLIGSTYAWFTDTASTGVNKIQAGNLDVEVEYSKNGTSWTSIEGTESLFSDNLWEPGHTEYVYLKVKNAGTLAFRYKVIVSPVSENGGINVYNENFKLSDYLKFGTTEPNTTQVTFADRNAARAAVTTTENGLKQSGLTKEVNKLEPGNDNYMALVVYMPEDVDNYANAKPDTSAPSIDLGIHVVATQVEKESDSFNDQYDTNAKNDSKYTVGPTYNYFPQIMETATVNTSGETVITASGKLNASDTTVTTLAEVKVPREALDAGVTEITVSVKPQDATNSGAQNVIQTETNSGRETANFDIKVSGIKENNTSNINVKVYVGTGLANVNVYHNGIQIEGASYDPSTGYVTFATTSFSDFTVAYDAAVAAIGTKTYGSLQLAVDGAKNDETVQLLKNSSGQVKISADKNITLDLNGMTVTNSGTTILNNGTLTIKNGNVSSTKNCAIASGNNSHTTINSGTYTGQEGAVITGKVTGATIIINDGIFNAVDNAVIAGNGSNREGEPNTITVNGGTFNGGIVTSGYVACGIYVPWKDVVTVNGGTFNIRNGAGIVARAGNVSVTGGTFNTNGNATGKVGDSRIVVPCAALVFDSEAKYPALSDNSKINVTGGLFKSEAEVIATVGSSKRITVTGGTFSSDPSEYLTDDYQALKKGNSYEVKAFDTWSNNAAQSYSTPIDDETKVVTISSAEELALFANDVNANNKSYSGYTVNLTSDIDLAGKKWTPIGNVVSYPGITFAGTFDGNGHTISNMYAVDHTANYASAGLFGSITGIVKNVTITNATVISNHYAGGICGYSSANVGMSIENCKVENSTITTIPELIGTSWDNGDKAGGIIGYCVSGDTVTGNTVENTIIKGYRDLGGIAGCAAATMNKNTVKNVQIVCDREHDYKKYGDDHSKYNLGYIYGRSEKGINASDNTEEGTNTITF